jgi:hypothetical protein
MRGAIQAPLYIPSRRTQGQICLHTKFKVEFMGYLSTNLTCASSIVH